MLASRSRPTPILNLSHWIWSCLSSGQRGQHQIGTITLQQVSSISIIVILTQTGREIVELKSQLLFSSRENSTACWFETCWNVFAALLRSHGRSEGEKDSTLGPFSLLR